MCASECDIPSAVTIENIVHHWTKAPQVNQSADEANNLCMIGQPKTGEPAGRTAGSSVGIVNGPRQRKRIQKEGM